MSAIATGYKRGIATIIDANVVTLITAFILFVLATAGVKGFAFTLGVGTLVSLFTAVLFTQAVLGTMGRSKLLRSPAMLGAGERHYEWNFDFMGKSKCFFAMSGMHPADRLARAGDEGAQLRHRLRERHARHGQPRARRQRRGACATRSRRSGSATPRSRRSRTRSSARTSSRSRRRELGPGGVQRLERLLDAEVRRHARGLLERVASGRRSARRWRAAPAIAIVASLLADHGLRRVPVRAEVRDPGDDRAVPRPADHGGRLLAHRPGGDDVDGRGDPDDPRLSRSTTP